jgi:hypothetical protein
MEELASATAERKTLSGAKCVPPSIVRRGGAETEREMGDPRRTNTVAVVGRTPVGTVLLRRCASWQAGGAVDGRKRRGGPSQRC